ncbi:hypothetical protein FPOAC2_09795 [Fusarium poae]|uniref:hypothetical protein n=1 Tax=Fusarium poae TaxID=36050 RepID=UPI001CEADD5F|nr:hypothetical protein FPOAC1_009848 [Fusarium poae]KAG8670434.1 hypothetical protein FPOAC1_009848 [Fusarium poae]
MSLAQIDPFSALQQHRLAISTGDLEWPSCPPPPLPPKAPPLPVLVQKPVETTFWDGTMIARPRTPIETLQKQAEARLTALEVEARKNFFGPLVAHLPHSEKDWTASSGMLAAGSRCIIPAAGCSGLPIRHDNIFFLYSRLGRHLWTKAHIKHEEEKRRESEGVPLPSQEEEQEPEFVMYRTMDIKFLDPPTPTSSS